MTYLQVKNFTVDLDDELKSFELGRDGLPYAVFHDNSYTYEYNDHIDGWGIGCFNGYENAVCLQYTIGL